MIIKPVYTTGSIHKKHIDDHDFMALEYLVSQYGSDIVFDSINEAHSYYGTGGNFDRTGGSRVSGISGFLQSIPSLAITTAICWPVTLLAGLGALSYRFRENYEDKNSWLNRLNPRFWVDYLATPSKSKKSSSSYSSSSSSNKSDKKSWKDRVKAALFGAGAGGAVAGAAALAKDSSTDDNEEIKETAMNAIFVPYWVTLSNGEVIRVKTDSEEHAKAMANMIVSYNRKPVYEALNYKIERGCSRYKFIFDDGEVCYWAAPDQKQAYKEALESRTELCNIFNKVMPGFVVLEVLDKPKIEGKVEISKERIPVPEQNKFINITTTQPEKPVKEVKKELPKPTYKYGSLSNYKVTYANFLLNIPGYKEGEAMEITRLFNSHYANDYIRDIYDNMDKRFDLYRVVMQDGDIYVIPGKTVNEVGRTGKDLYHAKVESIKEILQDAALDEYNNFLDEYGEFVDRVKDVKIIDPAEFKDYNIKPGDYANIKKVVDKDEIKKYPKFKL